MSEACLVPLTSSLSRVCVSLEKACCEISARAGMSRGIAGLSLMVVVEDIVWKEIW